MSKYVERYQPSNPKSNMRFDVAYQVLPQARAIENRMFVIQANAAEMVQNVGVLFPRLSMSSMFMMFMRVSNEWKIFAKLLPLPLFI